MGDIKKDDLHQTLQDKVDKIDTVDATVNAHLNDNTKHITSTERTNWNAKATQTDLDTIKYRMYMGV